ncbi:hypothetical protein ACFLZB_01140 [Nanoarchaeota archaeon]
MGVIEIIDVKRGALRPDRQKIIQTISQIKDELNNPVSQLKEEIDDHLGAINENTQEIQANFTYLCELGAKIDKLAQRLDHIDMVLSQNPTKIDIKPLTCAEKQVFLTLYTQEAPLTYEDIANETETSVSLVREYVDALIEKGVPIVKTYFNSRPFLKLDQHFKELQAKENLVNISLKSFIYS